MHATAVRRRAWPQKERGRLQDPNLPNHIEKYEILPKPSTSWWRIYKYPLSSTTSQNCERIQSLRDWRVNSARGTVRKGLKKGCPRFQRAAQAATSPVEELQRPQNWRARRRSNPTLLKAQSSTFELGTAAAARVPLMEAVQRFVRSSLRFPIKQELVDLGRWHHHVSKSRHVVLVQRTFIVEEYAEDNFGQWPRMKWLASKAALMMKDHVSGHGTTLRVSGSPDHTRAARKKGKKEKRKKGKKEKRKKGKKEKRKKGKKEKREKGETGKRKKRKKKEESTT